MRTSIRSFKLHIMKIELAIQRQLVLELKADLQKAKEAPQAVKEVVEASEQAAYDRGVQETQTQLVEELAEVPETFIKGCMRRHSIE